MAEQIICFCIYLLVALLMLGIGISQWNSKEPVGFYTGEKPPAPQSLSDVSAWNRKHGAMWILYGILIIISGVAGVFGTQSIWSIIPLVGGVVVPIGVMVWYHHRLINQYRR